MIRLRALPLAASLAVACTGADDRPVAVVEIPLGEPLVLIGAVDSLPGHELYRVSAAAQSDDGRLYIANGGTGEIRVFSADGKLLQTFSGLGAGPGEHQSLSRLWIRQDTLVTFDPAAQKVAYWSLAGALIRELRLVDGPHLIRAQLNDGRSVGTSTQSAVGFPRGTSQIVTARILLIDAERGSSNELARAPALTMFAATLPDGRTIYTPLPLEPQLSLAAGRRGVFVGYGADSTISVYAADGTREEVLLPLKSRPLTAEVLSAWQSTMLARVPADEQPQMERYLGSLPYSETLPRFDRMSVDSEDRIWIRDFLIPGADSVAWSVLGSTGNVVGRIRTPASFEFQYAANSAVVGSMTGPSDVEQVGVWRVHF